MSANIYFDDISFFDAVNEVKQLSRSSSFSYVVTPNVDHMQRLASFSESNRGLHGIYQRAALSLCDSQILDKLLRMKGKKIREIVPGSTLTQYLFDNELTGSDKILIVGVEDKYIQSLRKKYPHLNIEHINPSMGFINKEDEVAALLEKMSIINANYIFISVGSPRQEILANRMAALDSFGGVGLCVGASILFVVGAEKRAPQLFQTLHLEWLYRIVQNPRRLTVRYVKNFLSLPSIMRSL